MRNARLLLRGIGLCLGLCAGCSGQEEADGSALCEDVAQAVAQRTLACGGDVELGNARYAGILDSATCIASAPRNDAPDFGCSKAVTKLSCDEVDALGDDYRAWVTRSECAGTFATMTDGGANDATGDAP